MSSSTDPGRAGDSMASRTGSRAKRWVLLRGDRWLVAGGVLAVLFVGLVVLGAIDPAPLRATVRSSDPIETLFQALVTAIVTGVTLVVTINQLVLSQELGAVGDQRDRMAGAMQFRREVESALDTPVSPNDPSSFMAAILQRTADESDRLAAAAAGFGDEGVRTGEGRDDGGRDGTLGDRVDAYVRALRTDADEATRRLEAATFGSFDVVHAALVYDYSEKIHRGRQLAADVAAVPDAAAGRADALDAREAIVETLELFAPAREHVKTLYFQWELINLSQAVLSAAVPALLVTSAMVLYVDDPGTVTGSTLGVDHLVWIASAAATVAFLPFALLLSFILRISTVAKRTLAIGPFVLRSRGSDDEGR